MSNVVTVAAADLAAILKATLPGASSSSELPQFNTVLLEVGESFHAQAQARLMAFTSDRYCVMVDEAVFDEADEKVEFWFLLHKESAKTLMAWVKSLPKTYPVRLVTEADETGHPTHLVVTDVYSGTTNVYGSAGRTWREPGSELGDFPNVRRLVDRELFVPREITRSSQMFFNPDVVATWKLTNIHRPSDGRRGERALTLFFPELAYKPFLAQYGDHFTGLHMPRRR